MITTYDTPLLTALEQLGPHDHQSLIYESQEDRFAVAIPFVRIGLDRGEKCIYIADDGMAAVVRKAMYAQGIDVERALAMLATEGGRVSEVRSLRCGTDAHVLDGRDG